jgi:thiol:disulfide interchange protein DsbD
LKEFLAQTQQYLEGAPALALLASFLGGILASYTPCVYPMIPVVVGVIGAKGATSRLKGLFLSLIYVLGMSVTYAALGLIAALSGKFFGSISSHPLGYFVVANVCILFGLSMFGLFDFTIPLPQSIKNLGLGGRRREVLDIFVLGAVSGLIAAPCTVPVFGTLLTFAALKKNLVFGFLLLFVFSLGMGLLLVVFGTFSGFLASLPKSGPWPSRVKIGFGIFMLLVGEYFLVKMGQLLV